MLEHLKAAIFDLDGTLLDSMQVWGQIDVDFLAERGIALPEDYQAAITPMSPYEAAVYTIERFHFSDTPEELMHLWHSMAFYYYRDVLELKPGAYEYVRQLHAEGIPMVVASSSFREMIEAALDRTGLLECFSAIVTTEEVERGKQFPDIYLKCAEILQVKPEQCAVFEDIAEAIQGANAGGFFTIGVKEPGQDEETMRRIANRFINGFAELM